MAYPRRNHLEKAKIEWAAKRQQKAWIEIQASLKSNILLKAKILISKDGP